MIVANPIYDIVFKYLMEDERIARTILSALLKKNIVKVEVRPHEYANDKRDPLSIFRFDFAATEPQFDQATDLAINTLCKAMAADKNLKVRVTGHTDDRGTEAGNMRYGQKRAEALKALMVQRGAPAANISTDSKGQNEPVVDNDTDEHRYQNRRAVITIQ